MNQSKRPKLGDGRYTAADAEKDITELQSAVLKSPDAVEEFYKERGGAVFTGKALALAARYRGLKTVQVLINNGASFEPDPKVDVKYASRPRNCELMLLHGIPPMWHVRKDQQCDITSQERRAIIRLLYEHTKANYGNLLYYAILYKDFDLAEELIDLGVRLPRDKQALVTGDGVGSLGLGLRRERQKAYEQASDAEFRRMIELFRKCPGVDKVALQTADVVYRDAHAREHLKERFTDPDMLVFALNNTTLYKAVIRETLFRMLVEKDSLDVLECMIQNGLLNLRTMIDELLEIVDSYPIEREQIRLRALDLVWGMVPEAVSAAHPKKTAQSSTLSKAWDYKICGISLSEIRIIRYTGTERNVIIPQRLEGLPVTEIAPGAFPALKTDGKEIPYTSVVFPGSIRCLTQCFGGQNGISSVRSVILQHGIREIGDRALSGTYIEEIHLPDSIVKIGKEAFAGCARLSKVRLPKGLKELPEGIFAQCPQITELPGCFTIKSVGKNAFAGSGLSTAYLPNATKLAEGVFADCAKLKKVVLSERLRTIPTRLLSGCVSLTRIAGCRAVITIEPEAFINSGLREVDIGPSVQRIGRSAFAGCKDLESIRLRGPVQNVPQEMCKGCESLHTVVLPDTVVSIGRSAFADCTSFNGINNFRNVRQIRESAFQNSGIVHLTIKSRMNIECEAFSECANLTDVYISCPVSLGPRVFKGCRHLTSAAFDRGTVDIPRGTFSGCTALAAVSVPKTVKTIGVEAFRECGIPYIQLPESLQALGDRAFQESGLKQISIPNVINTIGNSVFYGCEHLHTVTMMPGIGKISNEMFCGCTHLTSVRIPDTVREIGESAFCETSFREINIPSYVTSIGAYAFRNSGIERVVIPSGVSFIGSGAFSECPDLRRVILPTNIVSLTDRLFFDCVSLKEIVLPDSLEKMGEDVFCSSGLKKIRIPDGVRDIPGNAFYLCTNLEEVVLPRTLQKIHVRAFRFCLALRAIQLPDTLNYIGIDAFCYSGLTKVRIPASVQIIESGAFKDCEKLDRIDLESRETEVADNAFSGTPGLQRLKQTNVKGRRKH